MNKPFFIFILLIFLVSAASCTVSQNFTFTKDGVYTVGTNKTDVRVSSFFVGVMEDLSSWQEGPDGKDAVQDAVENYVKTVSSANHAFDVDFTTPQKNRFIVSFSFSDLRSLIAEISGTQDQNIFTVTKKGNRTRVDFCLDMSNYATLTKIVPFLADENFAVYGPEYNHGMSEEDYLEMIGFVFGDEGPQSIKDSQISVELTLPSWLSASNGKPSGKNSVVFSIPLIDLLLLNKPIKLWCEF